MWKVVLGTLFRRSTNTNIDDVTAGLIHCQPRLRLAWYIITPHEHHQPMLQFGWARTEEH